MSMTESNTRALAFKLSGESRRCVNIFTFILKMGFLFIGQFCGSNTFAQPIAWATYQTGCEGISGTSPSQVGNSCASRLAVADYQSVTTYGLGNCTYSANQYSNQSYRVGFANCSVDVNRHYTDRVLEQHWLDTWYFSGQCPSNAIYDDTTHSCKCPVGQKWAESVQKCMPAIDLFGGKSCHPGHGDPIYPTKGTNRQAIELGLQLQGHPGVLVYDTERAPWGDQAPGVQGEVTRYGDFGRLWTSSWHHYLTVNPNSGNVEVIHGSDLVSSFLPNNSGGWDAALGSTEKLGAGSSGSGYFYVDRAAQTMDLFDNGTVVANQGLLQSMTRASGMKLVATHSTLEAPGAAPAAGYMLSLSDPFGRRIAFSYKAQSTLSNSQVVIDQITDPNGRVIMFSYDANANLTSLTWPDGRVKTFTYDSPNPNQGWALTGVADENEKRYASFSYDLDGWAKSTKLNGDVFMFSASYERAPKPVLRDIEDQANGVIWRCHEWIAPVNAKITQPFGAGLDMIFYTVAGDPKASGSGKCNMLRFAGYRQQGGSGCGASNSNISWDSNGNKASEDDFNGHRTCYAYSSASTSSVGNLEITRVEGLPKTAVCTDALAAASLPATTETAQDGVTQIKTQSRKISTQWHPMWALKTKQAEPNLLTTWVYNGQPDPFNGNQTASCVTNTFGGPATLPDGSPITVLCRKVEQRTTDSSGSLGFGATLDTSDPDATMARQWKYSYTEYGHVLTSKGPMSLDEVTTPGQLVTYTYYPDTSFTGTVPNEVGHTKGDLQTMSVKVSDTASLVTNYLQYDRSGHLLKMSDANDLLTTMSYAPRGWLTSVNQGGLLTQYEYWPTGLLKKATQPDGSYLYYKYDDAHRLTDVGDKFDATTDNFTGNWVHYTLDNAGNRTSEDVKDSGGNLTRNITRTYDALNRLQTVKGQEQ